MIQQKDQKLSFKAKIAEMDVFLVDDQDVIRKAMRRILSQMGFVHIEEFHNGAAAVVALNLRGAPDLIITDLYMDKSDGFSVIKGVRELRIGSDAPVLVVTGEASKEDIIKANNLGANGYLLKPFQVSEFEKKIEQLLQSYETPSKLISAIRAGEKLVRESNYTDALKIFEIASRIDPTSCQVLLCKAVVMYKMNQLSEAIRLLEKCMELNSSFVKGRSFLADIYLGLDQKKKGIESLRLELEINPKQPKRQELLGDILLGMGDLIGAEHHYKEANKEERSAKRSIKIGRAICSNDQLERGVEYFKKARRIDPSSSEAMKELVSAFEAKDQLEKAVPHLQSEMMRDQKHSSTRTLLAKVYEKLGKSEKANAVIDAGLKLNPTSSTLVRIKVKQLMAAHKTSEAVELCTNLVQRAPLFQNRVLLARTLMITGDKLKAYQIMYEDLKSLEHKQEALIVLSKIYMETNQPRLALHMLLVAQNIEGVVSKESLEKDYLALRQELQKSTSSKANKLVS